MMYKHINTELTVGKRNLTKGVTHTHARNHTHTLKSIAWLTLAEALDRLNNIYKFILLLELS